ncbi:MAG: hypothetical protein J0H68_01505 [Sphingobacteriia bacterium]|nr:hypothetical protein [Sphingobacteriia bacterium]
MTIDINKHINQILSDITLLIAKELQNLTKEIINDKSLSKDQKAKKFLEITNISKKLSHINQKVIEMNEKTNEAKKDPNTPIYYEPESFSDAELYFLKGQLDEVIKRKEQQKFSNNKNS